MSKFPSNPSDSSDDSQSYVKLLISDSKENEESLNPIFKRLFSAVFYGISSFLIIVVNKILLTNYR